MNICIDNININYFVKGEGANILLLHGWGSNIALFEDASEHLSKSFKVYALDMPGFGKSDEPPLPWAVDDYVDFVLKFIKLMDISKTILLGHSFGGRVIIKMVNRGGLPFVVPKIILVDSAGILPKKTMKQKWKLRLYKICKRILEFPAIKGIFPDALRKLQERRGSADYKSASPIMRQCLVKVVNEDLTHLLPTIKQPALLVWGENDTATPLSDGQLMEKLIPGSGLVTLKNAGHYSFIEQAFTFKKVLDSFLSGDKETQK